MSLASQRGKSFEQLVARMIRSKLGVRVSRDRQSGAGINKSDMSDYRGELPLAIECKDQATIKIKEWFRQADAARTDAMRAPTVVFRSDGDVLATLRLDDLLNFLKEIADQKVEIDSLRVPEFREDFTISKESADKLHLKKGDRIGLHGFGAIDTDDATIEDIQGKLDGSIAIKIKGGAKACRNRHLTDEYGYCNIVDCKYSRGYRKPKEKRRF